MDRFGPARLAALGVLLMTGACAPRGTPTAAQTVPTPSTWVVTARGASVSPARFADELAATRVVYVGERHDAPFDHEMELGILRAVASRVPRVIVGMEMFQRPYQDALDAYVEGRIDEAVLLERTDYRERWGFDVAFYRPLLEEARARGFRVLALNAPTELTRSVARSGLAALSASEAALLPQLDLGDAAHRRFVEGALRGHPGLSEEAIARFYEAQVVWDETMGDTLATALAAAPERTHAVVFAGAVHVAGGLGIPRTAARRGAIPYRIVLSGAAVTELADGEPGAERPWADYQVEPFSP